MKKYLRLAFVSFCCVALLIAGRVAAPPVSAQPVSAPAYFGATPVTASATGTIAATTATIPAVANRTAYICGLSIRATATAATAGNSTVTGTISGTMNFTQFTQAVAAGVGVTEPNIGPACIPASGPNVAIAVISAAPGAGGVVSVAAWGFYY